MLNKKNIHWENMIVIHSTKRKANANNQVGKNTYMYPTKAIPECAVSTWK